MLNFFIKDLFLIFSNLMILNFIDIHKKIPSFLIEGILLLFIV